MIKNIIKGKVKFSKGSDGLILDSEDIVVCKTRALGRIQKMEDALTKYDYLSNWIAEAINEKLEREELQNKLPYGTIVIIGKNEELSEVAKSIRVLDVPIVKTEDFLPIEKTYTLEEPSNPRSKKQGKGKHFQKRYNR